jgi:hypothetical protein
MKFSEARKILNDYCIRIVGEPASTNKSAAKDRRMEGARRAFWLENQGTVPAYNSNRTVAYLLAYLEIGEARMFGTGIPIEGRFIHPDRAVMKSLLLEELLQIDEAKSGKFSLTDSGKDFVAELRSKHPRV